MGTRMLIDELRERITSRPESLAWVRCDDRHEQLAGLASCKQTAETLGKIFDRGVWFDLRPLDSTLASAYGDKPFHFVKDCFAPIPPFAKCGFETNLNGYRSLTLFETVPVSGLTPYVYRSHLREEALRHRSYEAPIVCAFRV